MQSRKPRRSSNPPRKLTRTAEVRQRNPTLKKPRRQLKDLWSSWRNWRSSERTGMKIKLSHWEPVSSTISIQGYQLLGAKNTKFPSRRSTTKHKEKSFDGQ